MNTIKNKRNAIVLVPEITLTTQLINRFRSVFNDKIAVFHSGLSDGEKYDEYRRIRNKFECDKHSFLVYNLYKEVNYVCRCIS